MDNPWVRQYDIIRGSSSITIVSVIIQGNFHPSKRTRKRYDRFFTKVLMQGKLIAVVYTLRTC